MAGNDLTTIISSKTIYTLSEAIEYTRMKDRQLTYIEESAPIWRDSKTKNSIVIGCNSTNL